MLIKKYCPWIYLGLCWTAVLLSAIYGAVWLLLLIPAAAVVVYGLSTETT